MPGTGSSPGDTLRPHAAYRANYDAGLTWTATDASGNATVTNAYSDQVSAFDVAFYSTSQWTQLRAHFDWYQHFRCAGYSVEWIPRFRDNDGVVAQILLDTQIGSPARLDNSVALCNFFAENAEITLIADLEDTIIRNNNIDEYLLVRANPKCHTGPVKKPLKLFFVPSMLDVTVSDMNGLESTSPENNLQGQPVKNYAPTNSNSSTIGAITETSVVPEMNKWRSTKISAQTTTGATKGTSLNVNETLFGYKWYTYTPFNSASGVGSGNGTTVGFLRVQSHWEFMDVEYRMFVQPPQVTMDAEQEKQLTLLRKIHGEKYMLQSHKHNPRLAGPRIIEREVVEAAGHQVATQNRQRDTEEDIAAAKKQKTTPADPSPAQSSQGTPAPQKARYPLGLAGSR